MAASTDVKNFPGAKIELIEIDGNTVGRFVIQGGWKWPKDLKPVVKTEWCEAPHFQ